MQSLQEIRLKLQYTDITESLSLFWITKMLRPKMKDIRQSTSFI